MSIEGTGEEDSQGMEVEAGAGTREDEQWMQDWVLEGAESLQLECVVTSHTLCVYTGKGPGKNPEDQRRRAGKC